MVKYRITYRSYDESIWTIDLSTGAYTGDPIAVKGSADNACVLEWDGGVDDPFDNPLVTSKANINFINEGQVDVEELQNASDRDFIVEVYRNNALKWKGYMVVDQIQRPLMDPPYVVRITAIDGLNMLEAITLSGLGTVTTPAGVAVRAPLNWIRLCLGRPQNLGLMLPIRWHIGLEAEATQDDAFAGQMTWSPFGDGIIAGYYVNPGTGEQEPIYQNCRYIVEGLVKAFGARIFQDDGAWHIMRNTDIIDGTFTYNECDATLGLPTITQHTVDINRLVNRRGAAGGDYKYIREDALVTVKPALSYVDVRYDQDQSENILPNGSLDVWPTGALMYWGFTPNPNTSPMLFPFESLIQQPGQAVQLTNGSGATEDAVFTFAGSLPLDSNLLFKRMTWGFTIMPLQGFELDEYGNIVMEGEWPIRARVSYTIRDTNGNFATAWLNRWGFWYYSIENSGPLTISISGDTVIGTFGITLSGGPIPGQTIFFVTFDDEVYNYEVTAAQYNDLVSVANSVASVFPGSWNVTVDASDPDNVLVSGQIPGGGGFTNWGANRRPDLILPDNWIPIDIQNARIGDIIGVVFQGQGGNNEVLFPDPGQPGQYAGQLKVEFAVLPGQQYVLDEVWMRVDQNSDVYRADVQGDNNKSQEIVLGISSSFSGFMVSNLMRSYDLSGQDFIWTDGTTQASLTEHYARSVMRWRYKPSRIFNGTINTRGKDWKLLEIYSFDGLGEAKFLPLKARYNTERNEVDMVAMEGRDDTVTMDIKHYGSNNMPLSNRSGF